MRTTIAAERTDSANRQDGARDAKHLTYFIFPFVKSPHIGKAQQGVLSRHGASISAGQVRCACIGGRFPVASAMTLNGPSSDRANATR
jgi:hypothetical protein